MIPQYKIPTEQELRELEARHAQLTYAIWDKYDTPQKKPSKINRFDENQDTLNKDKTAERLYFRQCPTVSAMKKEGGITQKFAQPTSDFLETEAVGYPWKLDSYTPRVCRTGVLHEERTLPTYEQIVEEWYR